MEALASTRSIHSSAFACPVTEETHARKVRVRRRHTNTWMMNTAVLWELQIIQKSAWCWQIQHVCSHSGELVKISSHLTLAANSLLKTAAGNNPDQDAASLRAVCHEDESLQLSHDVSVGVVGLEGDRYLLKLLRAPWGWRFLKHHFPFAWFPVNLLHTLYCSWSAWWMNQKPTAAPCERDVFVVRDYCCNCSVVRCVQFKGALWRVPPSKHLFSFIFKKILLSLNPCLLTLFFIPLLLPRGASLFVIATNSWLVN